MVSIPSSSNIKVRVAIELAYPLGWERYVGDQGIVIAIPSFGASAPGEQIMKEFGSTVEHVVKRVEFLLS